MYVHTIHSHLARRSAESTIVTATAPAGGSGVLQPISRERARVLGRVIREIERERAYTDIEID